MSVTMEPNVATTPLPIPVHFSHAQQSFSLKKRRFPFSASSSSALISPTRLSRSLPPRPPSKGCPPVSRLFPHEPPSAWTPLSCSLIAKPPLPSIYDPKRQQSFFCQCFTNLGLLGRGSFGEVYKVRSSSFQQFKLVSKVCDLVGTCFSDIELEGSSLGSSGFMGKEWCWIHLLHCRPVRMMQYKCNSVSAMRHIMSTSLRGESSFRKPMCEVLFSGCGFSCFK